MRFDLRLCAATAALFSGTLALGASAVAAEMSNIPIYEASSAAPPVDHIIRPLRVRECRRDSTNARSDETRSEALARLRRKASSMGANGLLHVEVTVTESEMRHIAKGMPNPCRFETVAMGDAAVLGGSNPTSTQLAAAPK